MSLLWYIKSDIDMKFDIVHDNGSEKITGFKFYTKSPFSNSYQYHASIGLEETYSILGFIQKAIKQRKRKIIIQISSGMVFETVCIWKGSFQKAENELYAMIKQIQHQYS